MRGCAAGAIASLLYEDKALLSHVEPAISSLVSDEVACVRAAAIGAIVPVLNIDRDRAVELFLRAISGTTEQVLRTRHAQRFIGYTLSSHLSELRPALCSMIGSSDMDVAEDGATWVTLAYLFKGECQNEFEQCSAGSPRQRKGVANALASNIDDERVAAMCSELLPAFFNDEDREVRNAASVVRHRDLNWTKTTGILETFFRSRVFRDDPRGALWILESLTVDLRSLSESIFVACDSQTEAAAQDRENQSWDVSSAFDTLATMLLRLYGHTDHKDRELRRKCLDRWDAILRTSRWLPTSFLHEIDQ